MTMEIHVHAHFHFVMTGPAAGRVPAIHAFSGGGKDADARDKPAHDGEQSAPPFRRKASAAKPM
jgi:hypothetical protein